MTPLFMDTGSELNSPGSVSAEGSNTGGSEREGEGQPVGNRGRKRQEKNRDAARKSRRKQTERADELHEELQCIEQSNSALKKEIAALKKDLQLYTTALERHKPFCRLKDSTTLLSTSASDYRSGSSPPQASNFAASPPFSTSLTSIPALQNTQPASSAPPTTLASPSDSSTELFSGSPVSFSTVSPHSLFSGDPPPLNVSPVCTGLLVSNPLAAAAPPRPGQGTAHESSPTSANANFSPLDEFLMTQDSFLTTPPNAVPLYSQLAAEITGVVGCHVNEPQLHLGRFSRNSTNSSSLQDPALQAPPVTTPASAFEPSYSRLSRVSLLSMLTVPSPPNVSQTGIFDGPPPPPPPSLPLLGGDMSRDLSLSELLEGNDWIISGTGHQ